MSFESVAVINPCCPVLYRHLTQCKLFELTKVYVPFVKCIVSALLDVQTALPPQGCCEGVVFKAQTEGCCQGRIYTKDTRRFNSSVKWSADRPCLYPTSLQADRGFSVSMAPRKQTQSEAVQSCCGGQTLYDSETHGCCLEKGPQVENHAKTEEEKQHLTSSDYFDVFWCHFEAEFVLNIRDPCTVEEPERWAATLFLQQWKQKCRSSELKDASLRRTFSNCKGNVRIEWHWDIRCPSLGIGTEHCSARCTLMAATIAADGPKASVVSVLAKRVAAADVTDPCSLAWGVQPSRRPSQADTLRHCGKKTGKLRQFRKL